MMNVKVAVTREDFEAIIEAYKARNPKKYELKKKELEAKLASYPSAKKPVEAKPAVK